VLSKEHPIRKFVKIVREGCTPLGRLSPEKLKEKTRTLEEFFGSLETTGVETISVPTCHQSDWLEVLKLARPEVLYVFADQSASADEVYFTKEGHSLHLQLKNRQANLTAHNILQEAEKVAVLANQDCKRKYSLVVVALNINKSNIQAAVEPLPVQVVHDNRNISLRLPPGSKITIDKKPWLVPSNMDIIILEEDGVAQLITKYNLALLKNGNLNIEKYLEGLPPNKV
jgi:hypothetical protein